MKVRAAVLCLATIAGFVAGAASSSEVFRVVVLLVVVAAGAWLARGLFERPSERPGLPGARNRRVDTYWPARCSHCGVRAGPRTRMVAGRDAYICELCLRRGLELLDSPEDITRFM